MLYIYTTYRNRTPSHHRAGYTAAESELAYLASYVRHVVINGCRVPLHIELDIRSCIFKGILLRSRPRARREDMKIASTCGAGGRGGYFNRVADSSVFVLKQAFPSRLELLRFQFFWSQFRSRLHRPKEPVPESIPLSNRYQ